MDMNRRTRRWRKSIVPVILSFSLATLVAVPAVAAKEAMKPERFEAAYRGVLATLAQGQEEQALAELYELETTVMRDRPTPGRVDHFWRLKLGVVRELIQGESVEILVPIVVLHHDAYVMYRQREQPELAVHSRQMSAELAEYYGNKSSREEARLFTGWVLTSFGAYLQDSWALATSAELFERALQRDPTNVVALVRLGAAFEKSGEYENAVERLERAARLRPDDAQIAVRLALCMARSDELMIPVSIERLQAVIDTQSTSWVISIAYQELARLLTIQGRSDAAEQVLREGLARMPGDQYMAVELSQILDRRRSPREAARVLAVVAAGDWQGQSPRYLYNTWPEVGIDVTRASLRSTLQTGLVPLEAGLRWAAEEGVGR